VVGSFLPSSQQEQKLKKPKSTDYVAAAVSPVIAVSPAPTPAPVAAPAPPAPPTNAEKEDVNINVMGGGHVLQNSGTLNSNLSPSNAFRRDSWVNMHSMTDTRKSATDINISLPDC